MRLIPVLVSTAVALLIVTPPVTNASAEDSTDDAPPAAVLFDLDMNDTGIHLMDPDGSNPIFVRLITNLESGAAFVPSGRRILFTDRRDPEHKAPDLYTMQRDGSHLRQLTVAAASDTQPDPSPDGDHVIFTRTIDGEWYVYRMPMTGETDEHRAIRLSTGWSPQYTPDGMHIVFIRDTSDTNADVWIMRKNGTHLRQLTSSQPERDEDPTVSPDGRHIVWSREGDLFAMRIDGSHKRRLTDPDWYDRNPVFSPNGKSVMFSREQDGNDDDVDILRKPFPTGAADNLTDPAADTRLEWVQDWWGPALTP